ncbi:MAG: glycosyltransferase family 87 protein [Bryobacterales bacterium]
MSSALAAQSSSPAKKVSPSALVWFQRGIFCLLFAVPLAIGIYAGSHFEPAPGHPPDYAIYLNASSLIHSGRAAQLYDLDVQRENLTAVTGGRYGKFIVWNHAPFEALLYYPAAWFSLEVGYRTAGVLNSAIVLLLGAWFVLRVEFRESAMLWGTLVGFAAIPFLSSAINMGQDSAWILVVVIAAMEALRRGRDGLAGLMLGLAAVKITVVIPLLAVLFLAGYRRTASIGIAAATGGFLVAALLLGFSAVAGFFSLLVQLIGVDGEYGLYSNQLWNFRGVLIPFLGATKTVFLLTAVGGVAGAFLTARLPKRYIPGMALLVAAFFSPHLYRHDAVFYVGGVLLLLVAKTNQRARSAEL